MKHSSDNNTDKILRIPEGVTKVNREQLLGRSDWEEIYFPESAVKLAGGTFQVCPHIRKLEFGNPDIEIDRYAFVG